MDSNHEYLIQSQVCYHYTTGQIFPLNDFYRKRFAQSPSDSERDRAKLPLHLLIPKDFAQSPSDSERDRAKLPLALLIPKDFAQSPSDSERDRVRFPKNNLSAEICASPNPSGPF